jgi:transposase
MEDILYTIMLELSFKDVISVTRCKNCQTVWNRDVNGATNIWKIALYTIHGQERPEYLCRT